jgi:hypothetical protein
MKYGVETELQIIIQSKKDSGLNFLKDTNVIQNLIWSICLGKMVARWLSFGKGILPQGARD